MQSSYNHSMQVDTSKKFMLEKSPDSPMKGRRDVDFSHFSRRYCQKLSESEIFSMKFNQDSSLAAASFSDGSLQILSTMLGEKLYEIKDEEMTFPITNLSWKRTRDES